MTAGASIRVTVVVPTYNEGPLLHEQLEALGRQEHDEPLEILVCDNGSTDGSSRAAASRPGVRVVDASARSGPAAARNAGVRAARGDAILFCDADDVVAPGWVRAMTAALEKHTVVVGRAETACLNSSRTRAARPLAEGLQAGGQSMPYAGAGNFGIRRRVFLEVGGFDESLSCLEDVEFCWRLQRAGHTLYYEPAAVVHVRLRGTFRSQFRQGHAYGRGWALLEDRDLAAAGGTSGSSSPPAEVKRHESSRWSTLRMMLGRMVRHPVGGLGNVVWALGWHLGHRFPASGAGTRTATQTVHHRLVRHVSE